MWNKNMILINNPYHSPTKHNPDGKFCPMGIIDRNKYCILPCFFYDSQYCTYWMYSAIQEKATKEWKMQNKFEYKELRDKIHEILFNFFDWEFKCSKKDEFDFEFLELRTDEILKLIQQQGGSIDAE